MHEMGLARSLIEILLDELAHLDMPREKQAVSAVHFRAGRLHNILPESLMFYYDMMKAEDDRLKDSTLEIAVIDEKAKCNQCGTEFLIDAPIFVCPACNGPATLIDGRDMYIEKIDLFSEDQGKQSEIIEESQQRSEG